jgi:hypothetical protein
MATIPRHYLVVRFADYKQKDLAVNGKINFGYVFALNLFWVRETPICPS